jgi:hypothetical protein
MNRIEQLKNEISEQMAKLAPMENELRELQKEIEQKTDERCRKAKAGHGDFLDDELVYAAVTRCRCGSGLAYPKEIGVHGGWYCSDILTGRATKKDNWQEVEHDDRFPFLFYSILSETQPRAMGSTTRPQ